MEKTCDIDWQSAPDNEMVCFCNGVTKAEIVAAIKAGADDAKSVHHTTNAGFGGNCMELNPRKRCCHSDINALIRIYGRSI